MKIEPIYRNIGTQIRDMRETRGWTQQQVAYALGVTRTSVVNIEAGRQRIMLHFIPEMASLFDMSPDHFLYRLWRKKRA